MLSLDEAPKKQILTAMESIENAKEKSCFQHA